MSAPLRISRPLNGTNYTTGFLSDMVVQGNTVLVPTSAFHFFGIFDAQLGNVLAIDVSNPAAPTLRECSFPDNNPYSQTNQFGATIVNDQIAYIASTTTHDGNTQNGVGRVLVVDYSDPTNPTDLGEVDIPGTYQILDVAVQGNRRWWWAERAATPAPATHGTMTLSVLDITNPSKPQLVEHHAGHQRPVPHQRLGRHQDLRRGAGQRPVRCERGGGQRQPELLLVNPSDPKNIGDQATRR